MRGLIVYRLRGRHYITLNHSDSQPTDLGSVLVAGIPEAPVEFLVWKRSVIDHYRAEEDNLLRLACACPGPEITNSGHWSYSEYWGYSELPSRRCPANQPMVWNYVIDLDLDVFRVSYRDRHSAPEPGQRDTQYFRLDNIPRALFPPEAISPDYSIMSESVPPENCANYLSESPPPDPTLLALYASFSPPPAATFSVPPGPRTSSWHKLQLFLVRHFVDFYAYSFRDACPSPLSSPFVFRQLAYAILSLTSTVGLKFYRATSVGHIDPWFRTPYWEPPNTDTYYLGDILIVLNPHLRGGTITASTHASIARAVQYSSYSPTIAVVFSVHAVVLVHIDRGGVITHTPALSLFTFHDTEHPFSPRALAALTAIGYASPGVIALLDLFVAHPRVPCIMGEVPRLLPTELWRQVFRRADEQTHAALEGCCRFFRVLAGENPKVGGGTLVGWRKDGFVWVGVHGEREFVVDLREVEEGEEGFDVVVWGTEKVMILMPPFGVF